MFQQEASEMSYSLPNMVEVEDGLAKNFLGVFSLTVSKSEAEVRNSKEESLPDVSWADACFVVGCV